MNTALIQHLESLPKEHLEVHIAAYPWFAAARVVLAKKAPSQAAIQQTVPYVQDRKWFKNYFEGKSNNVESLEKKPTPKNLTPERVETETSATNETEKVEIVEQNIDNSEKILDKAVPEEQEPSIATTQAKSPKSFADWLLQFSIDKKGKVVLEPSETTATQKTIKDELEMLIQSNIPYAMLETKLEAETHYAKGLSDFIAQQKRNKKQQLPAPNFDEKSRLPITETIANLLEKQGKIKQAIGIYEQLSLKFPQKSAYFAAHIQKLKEKI